MTRAALKEVLLARAENMAEDERARDKRKLLFVIHGNPRQTAEVYAARAGLPLERATERLDEMAQDGTLGSSGGEPPKGAA